MNTLAYQVSVFEAKRALQRDLDRFIDQISKNLSSKIAGVFALVSWLGVIGLLARGVSSHALGEYFLFAWVAAMPALLGGAVGMAVGEFIAKKIWKEEIALERKRLIERYPAAA